MAVRTPSDRRSLRIGRSVVAILAAVLLLAAPAGTLRAAPIVLSTLSDATPSFMSFGQAYSRAAQRFTTSNNAAAWSLESVRVGIHVAGPGTVNMQIFSDTTLANIPSPGPAPGSPIATLLGPETPTTGLVTFTAPGDGVALAANTDYWFVWSSAAGPFALHYLPDAPMSGDWSIPASGNSIGTATFDFWNLRDRAFGSTLLEISARAVPEIDPAGLGSVLALVTGALGLLERRRSVVA